MNDLPNASTQGDSSTPQTNTLSYTGSVHKEAEPMTSGPIEAPIPKESMPSGEQLPPEVASIGVKIHPTTIPIPQAVQQLGVQSIGANIGAPALTVALPLTDDQIARGLTQGITSSYHWLAEWCIRRLKQMHVGLKKIHGSITRVNQ